MKNKNRYTIFPLLLVSLLFSCKKIVDLKPLDIISGDQVWQDPNLIKAYITNLYSRVPLSGVFVDDPGASVEQLLICDEGRSSFDWWPTTFTKGLLNTTGGEVEYWDYNLVRDMNTFFKEITTAGIADDVKNQYIGEVKFLRAYVYFEMVKRYGGVPLILVPQDIHAGESLFIKRNTEKEIYDFIATECDESAAKLLVNTQPESGRVTQYAALALKSRAMLYAASEAKYGTVQLNGLVGIPSSDANAYWQKSLDASNAIISANKFELYNKYSDKAKNYQMIFLEKNNKEIILEKKYTGVQYGHSVDDFYETNANYSYWGCQFSPTLELINSFENIDGSSGLIDWPNVRGELPYILRNKDPRFHASILYNGQQWVNDTVRLWLGVYAGGTLFNSEQNQYKGIDEVGRDQQTSQGSKTGFFMKKFLDPTRSPARPHESDQDWMVYRYAEILLNYAEAAFELGNDVGALNAINQIRTRAGIAQLAAITLDKIRHERQIELVFETHRFWDLRRWHIAKTVLSRNFHGAFPYYDYDQGNFIYKVDNCEGYTRVFKEAYYYLPITEDRINNNPNLIENPGY